MRVTATKPGYHGKLRQPGEQFEVPDGSKASWYAPVEAEAKPKRDKPAT